jgi:hypothetical protein
MQRRPQRDQRRWAIADGRPVGDVAADGRRVADLLAGIAAQKLAKGGQPVRHRRTQRGNRDARTDMQLPTLHLDPLQVFHAVQEGHRLQVAQLLGHPKPDIRRPGDQHGIGVGQIPVGQFVTVARAEGVWPGCPRTPPDRPAPRHPVCIQSGTGALSAASAARMIGAYPVQRHRFPASWSSWSARRSDAPRPSTRQTPACRSRIATRDGVTIASCTGCIAPPLGPEIPSTVRTALPCSCGRNRMQAFSARVPVSSVTITVQAPQSPSLQPSLVPASHAFRAANRARSASGLQPRPEPAFRSTETLVHVISPPRSPRLGHFAWSPDAA